MNVIASMPITTTEQLLALEDDGVERMLIRGELLEKPMTRRNPRHSATTSLIDFALVHWLKQQPFPRGRVLAGEAGFRLRKAPDSTVGIDVAYIGPDLAGSIPMGAWLIDGTPVLAVEILSPSDTHGETVAKVREYLDVGIPLIWIVDPDFRTVTVYRPGLEPEFVNILQQLTGEPHLPGFSVAVAELFE